jgi:hypothetical protein
MPSLARSIPLAAVAAAAALAPAHAADPAEGTVSKSAKTFKWSGAAGGYGFVEVDILTMGTIGQQACEAPICDEFKLKVADAGGDLKLQADDGKGFIEMDVQPPGGDWQYNQSGVADKPTVAVIKNAPVGEYLIRVLTNQPAVGFDNAYNGTAALSFPAPDAGGEPPATTPPSTPPPSNPPSSSPPPSSGPPPSAPPAAPGQLPASGPLSVDAAMDKGKRATARTRGLRARLRCTVVCRASAVASIDKKTAAKLKLGKKAFVIAQGSARIDKPGRIPFVVKLNAKAKKALGKKVKGLKRLSVTVDFVVTDDQRGQLKQIKRKITLR